MIRILLADARRKLAYIVIAICVFGVIASFVFGEEVNHYNEITDMLQLPPVPYPAPANVSEAEANICYLNQNVKEILRANREALERFKRIIRVEKQMAKGE